MNGLSGDTPAWIRTKDQLIKSQLLYRLSYRGMGLFMWGELGGLSAATT